MQLKIVRSCENINWQVVVQLLSRAGLSTQTPERTQKAFEGSAVTVFIYDGEALVGTGRAISDGVYQAAVYDIAVLPEYQGKSVGRMIMEEINKELSDYNILLYARHTAVDFYKKLGYSKMLTGMAKFKDALKARDKKFIE